LNNYDGGTGTTRLHSIELCQSINIITVRGIAWESGIDPCILGGWLLLPTSIPLRPESSNFFVCVQFNENFSQSPMATEVAKPQGTWENVSNFAFFPFFKKKKKKTG